MIILGIDPGLASTGVGVIKETGPGEWRALHSTHVVTNARAPLVKRLSCIHELIAETVEKFEPDAAAIETIFFARNVRSAVLMAHGRGAALLAASPVNVLAEYSPLEIKQSVVGKGRAGKNQVAEMVTLLLSLREKPSSDHETDALAAALAHGLRSRAEKRLAAQAPEAVTEKKAILFQMKRSRRRRR